MTRIRTHHFTALHAAKAYYAPYCDNKRETNALIQAKLDLGEIQLGPLLLTLQRKRCC
jgi:hypothetical protein